MNLRDCRQVWATWFAPIQEDITDLANQKYIYTELRRIVQANLNLHGSSVLWTYVVRTWVHYAASGVRRQVKIDRNSTSMARLLQGIATTPRAISREWFVGRFANRRSSSYRDQMQEANSLFDEYAGRGKPFIDPACVKADSSELLRVAAPVAAYVDRMVAHLDAKPPSALPKLGDIHGAVDLLVNLLQKYHRIVFGGTLTVDPAADVGEDWKELFRRPWVR